MEVAVISWGGNIWQILDQTTDNKLYGWAVDFLKDFIEAAEHDTISIILFFS